MKKQKRAEEASDAVVVEYAPKTRIHRVFLRDGTMCAMASNAAGGPTASFQRLARHRVPVWAKARGARWSWTIRTAGALVTDRTRWPKHLVVGQGAELWLRPMEFVWFDRLKAELLADVLNHGHADVTTVYGKTSNNNGRLVLEMAHEPGQTYSYAGKTTAPGRAFGTYARQALEQIALDFGVAPDKLWAHLVYYPEPTKCKLDWHSDSEAGINPHFIVSVTFLEDPVAGVRPFDVRLKAAEHTH